MTLEAKGVVLAIFAVGLALVLQVWPRSMMSTKADAARGIPVMMAASLASVALALIVVGLVSGTLLTHLVQIVPLVLLLALLSRARALILVAAAALLSWWLVTMAAIWLFLLGVSRFLTGRFSPAEIFLTLVIGVACLVGLSAGGRTATMPLGMRVLTIVLAAGLQSLALWVSYQPIVIGR